MNEAKPRTLMRLALIVYPPLLASGYFVRAPGTFRVEDPVALAWGLALAALGTWGTVAASGWAARRTGWGSRLHEEFHRVMRGLDARQILLLALLSGFGEEILFRGVLQPRMGLWPATLLFTALHTPVRRTLIPWTAMVLVLGVALAMLTETTGTLWPAIVLHFGVNYFNLHALSQPLPWHSAEPPPKPPTEPPPEPPSEPRTDQEADPPAPP